jgi:hypothetical protein
MVCHAHRDEKDPSEKTVPAHRLKKEPSHGFKAVLTSVYLAEEALALPPEERATLARLLLESVAEDARSDAEIRNDLQARLARLRSGEDAGLSSRRFSASRREAGAQQPVSAGYCRDGIPST